MKNQEVKEHLDKRNLFDLQLFADPEPAPTDPADPESTPEPTPEPPEPDDKPVITPEMQAIINTTIGAEKKKLKEKLEKEKQEAITKAEKLAAMSEKERKEAEETERLSKLEEREKKVQQQEYRMEAVKQLGESNLNAAFADMVLADEPEQTATNIKALRSQIDAEIEAEVKKRLAGKSPAAGTGNLTVSHGAEQAKLANAKTVVENNPWKK